MQRKAYVSGTAALPRGAAGRLHGRLRGRRSDGQREPGRRRDGHGRRRAGQVQHAPRTVRRGRPRHPWTRCCPASSRSPTRSSGSGPTRARPRSPTTPIARSAAAGRSSRPTPRTACPSIWSAWCRTTTRSATTTRRRSCSRRRETAADLPAPSGSSAPAPTPSSSASSKGAPSGGASASALVEAGCGLLGVVGIAGRVPPPGATPADLQPRALTDLGDEAYLDDRLSTSGSTAEQRTVTVVFRTSNVIVTIQYEEQPMATGTVPDSREMQDRARNLASQLDDALGG